MVEEELCYYSFIPYLTMDGFVVGYIFIFICTKNEEVAQLTGSFP